MLGAIEKTVWALSLLCVVISGVYVGYFGLPSTTPPLAANSRQIQEGDLKLSTGARQDFDSQIQGVDVEGGEQKPRNPRPRPKTFYQVDRNLQQRLGNLSDCMQEMNFASSQITPEGTLKIFDIKEGSLLSKVGLEENDEIQRVLGTSIDFNDKLACHDVWQQSLSKLDSGTPIVIELRRNGQVRQLVITPGL